MSGLEYRGRAPTTDSSVVTKGWSDTQSAAVVVDADWVNSQIVAEVASSHLQLPGYVDTQDALRAHKTDVDVADTVYVPVSALGQTVAILDANGSLAASQVPAGTPTRRVGACYTGVADLAPGATHTVNTSTAREFKLAHAIIPDPGYPWRPLVLGLIGGWSDASVPPNRQTGTGTLGIVRAMPPAGVSDTIYGVAVCTGVYQRIGFYPLLPAGIPGNTPSVVPVINGGLEIDFWASCYVSSGYTFSGTGMLFQVSVYPAV